MERICENLCRSFDEFDPATASSGRTVRTLWLHIAKWMEDKCSAAVEKERSQAAKDGRDFVVRSVKVEVALLDQEVELNSAPFDLSQFSLPDPSDLQHN